MTRRRAVILTGHFPVQKRRANIPWLADEMRANGWHVTFVTLGYSWISRLIRDRRFQSVDQIPKVGLTALDDSLTALFHYAPIHPFSLRVQRLDTLLRPLHQAFVRYWAPRIASHLAAADLVVIESGPPLMLAATVRQARPDVPMVYRASDDIRLLGLPPFMTDLETEVAPLFDRISVASPILARRWAGHPGLAIDPIGVPIEKLARPQPDPYPFPRARVEALCAGTTLFDLQQAMMIARAAPHWRIHVIGRLRSPAPQSGPANLCFLGEQSFDTTVAHIRHADVGLAIYKDAPGIEYQTAQSNRILLYRHFRLPIIGPARLCDPSLPSIIGYDPGRLDSVQAAVVQAETIPPLPHDDSIQDWRLLYERITATRRLKTD
jgi:2-beta-glucuronyltransferase